MKRLPIILVALIGSVSASAQPALRACERQIIKGVIACEAGGRQTACVNQLFVDSRSCNKQPASMAQYNIEWKMGSAQFQKRN